MLSDINIKGTAYKIGGNIADGQWIKKSATVFSGTYFDSTGRKTYTISDYLPDNDYTYEVLVGSYGTTGKTAGDEQSWWIPSTGETFLQPLSYVTTRTASNVVDGRAATVPLKQVDGVITITVNVTSTSAGSNGLYLYGYRRLGTNE